MIGSSDKKKIFILSLLLSLCDSLLYVIIQTNLSFVIYKKSYDILSSFDYILVSFNLYCFIAFILSFFSRFFVTSKLLSTINKKDLLLSFLFSFVFVTANSFEQLNNSFLFSFSNTLIILSIIIFGLVFLFCINIILLIRKLLPMLNSWNPKLPVIFEKNIFLISFIFIFITWLPFIIFRYPAGIEWDGYHQLMMFEGDKKITQHWPIVSTYFFGIIYNFGKFIFKTNDNGIFFTVIIQSAVCIACFSYSIFVQKKLSVSNGAILFCLLSYALITIYPRYLTSIVKDALFSSIVLLFITFLTSFVFFKEDELKKRHYIYFLITCFLVCSLRHTGIYIIISCMFLSIIWFYASRKKICLKLVSIFLSSIVFFLSFSNIMNYSFGENPLSPKMMYCLPLQQTVRYFSKNKNSITIEQKEIINHIIDYDEAIKAYNPKLCDPIMKHYHANDFKDRINYLKKVWLPNFINSPLSHLAATYNQSEGFFFPFAKQAGKYMTYYLKTNNKHQNEVKYFSETPNLFSSMKRALIKYINFFESFFLFSFFCNCSLNIWAVISCLFYLKKSLNNILIIIPSLVVLLTLIAGPTFYWNGERYALPIICCNLFLISILSRKIDNRYSV